MESLHFLDTVLALLPSGFNFLYFPAEIFNLVLIPDPKLDGHGALG